MKPKISLYECQNAICFDGETIRCAKKHHLSGKSLDGDISFLGLVRGVPLVITVCQSCEDFDRNGLPIPKNERGWYIKGGK